MCLLVLLAGCETFTRPVHDPQAPVTESAAVHQARVIIDEANALLIAVNRTIGANVDAGVWTKTQAQDYLDESKILGQRLDQAREALRIGSFSDAQAQANALRVLIVNLQRRIAVEARKDQI
ncbi:MAG: hypothetical protein ACREUQ_00800 [Burkholderiales bacterium]